MESSLIIILLLFVMLIYTYVAPRSKARRRIKKLQNARKQLLQATAERPEESRKTRLNIPGYYEDIVNKDKLRKTYKWELHDSF